MQIIQRRWGSSDRAATSTPSSHGWSRSTGIGGRVQLECLIAFAWNRWSQSTGTRIQLAAMWNEADARRARDLFRVDLGPALSGLEPFIERADTANGVLYRVQLGPFTSLQDAEAVCDKLKQRDAGCFVIRR